VRLEAERLVAALAADPEDFRARLKKSKPAKSIFSGSPELQAAALETCVEQFAELRKRIPGRGAMDLLNAHGADGYSYNVTWLLQELFKRSKLPLSPDGFTRMLEVFGRYEWLSLLATPFLTPMTSFAEKFVLQHGLADHARRAAARIAKALFKVDGAAESRLGERLERLSKAR